MNSLNTYSESIRKDIAIEFGLEAGGYAPRPKQYLTIREAQRLNNKYPSTGSTRFDIVIHPKALVIIQRLKAIRIANEKKGH